MEIYYTKMNSKNLNWEWIRCFYHATATGSLSAAARQLALSQPTLSRNIQALERAIQAQLFQRSTQGLKLTPAGQALWESANEMMGAADHFQRQASGLVEDLKGTVRISANEIVGIYLLPPALAAFRIQYPEIQIELLITNQASSLNKREADIALRMFRPQQNQLLARRLPDLPLGFFAHPDYLKRKGIPHSPEELLQHDLIGFDEDFQMIDAAGNLGFPLQPSDFCLRTDHLLAQIQLARSGAGILVTHLGLARYWPELVEILQTLQLPCLEFWIVSHGDTQHSAPIRTCTQFLGSYFSQSPYRELRI